MASDSSHSPVRPDDESEFAGRLRDALDAGSQRVDEATMARLAEARAIAVARAGDRRGKLRGAWLGPRAWLRGDVWLWPAGALAASVIVAAVLVQSRTPGPDGFPAEDLELLVTAEDLELYEDLEFYEWLDSTQAQG